MKYEILKTEKQLTEYLEVCHDQVSFDTETTGLEIDCLLLGISMFDNYYNPVFIPTDYFFDGCMELSQIQKVFTKFKPKLQKIQGIAHNGKFDLTVFASNEIPCIPLVWDTMLMCHNYDSAIEKKLESRVREDLGVTKKSFEEIIGKKWDKIDWEKDVKSGAITLEQLAEYACEDVYYTFKLRDYYYPMLEKENLLRVHDKIELPLVEVLAAMYERGVRIDRELIAKMGVEIDAYQKEITEKIYEEAGAVFNINSGKQKAEILFDKLRLPTHKATKSGARSTDADTLEHLAQQGYKIAEYMVEYSELQKLNSGYIQGIPKLIDEDGRLRCNFNSAGTKTGRFSSNNPNLQNQPNNKRFPIRAAFIPDDGYKLQVYDYSQIELRVMAHVSKDKKFTEAFLSGADIHGTVAKDLGIDRKHAKIVNFGVLYGMGADSLAYNLGTNAREAKRIIDGYESTYRGYYEWKIRTEKFAKQNGYIKTIYGRIRRFPALSAVGSKAYFGALRQSVNTVIQGSAADIIKVAMIHLFQRIKQERLDTHILLQVHDELMFETIISQIPQAHELIKFVMENSTKLSVPLEVDGKTVDNWGQMKDDNFQSLLINYQNNFPLWLLH